MFFKWDITGKCNLNCKHCSVGKSYDFSKGNFKDLDTTTALDICDQIVAAGATDVQILGGEPFMRLDLLEILRKFSDANVRISINTNGQFITNKILDQLSKLKIDIIYFSLDGGTKETHDFIRGEGAFEKTMTKITLLNKNKTCLKNTKFGVNFVLMKHSQKDAKKLIDLCLEYDIKYLAINDLWVTQNAEENYLQLQIDNIKDKIKFLDEICSYNENRVDLKIEAFPLLTGIMNYKHALRMPTLKKCEAGNKIVYIQADGTVYPCIKCKGNDALFNLKDDSHMNLKYHKLEDILNSNYFKEFKLFKNEFTSSNHLCKQCKYNDLCTSCPFDIYEKNKLYECEYCADSLVENMKT